jgi:diguanylate cyclase (GGDEF)-like protein
MTQDTIAANMYGGPEAAQLTKTIASTATIKLANLPMLDLFYTPLEERFERITRVARRALGVPVAAITLLNSEKQWFKSVSGWAVTELPRERSLCNLTVESHDPILIADTRTDPRTSRHPLVVSPPGFRSYAGCRLTDNEGLTAGTLCVFGLKRRVFSSSDRQTLLDLAAMTQRELSDDQLRGVHASLTAKLSIARREAMMDPLTRLWNRRGAMLLLESTFQEADRKGIAVAVALLDLDGFKQINDTLGHQTGDEVLRKIGARLVNGIRGEDVACRIGGDEFLVLLVDSDSTVAKNISERVRRRIMDVPVQTRDGAIAMTASFGFTIRKPQSTASVEELLERADRALRLSKTEGRNRTRIVD